MVMVDLGIPPGFDLLSEDLQVYHEKSAGLKSGRLEKFQFDGYAGHPVLRFVCARRHGGAQVSFAREVSDSCAHVPFARIRILRIPK